MRAENDEPRWVATGPLLPLGMLVATFVAALKYPGSPLLWTAVGLCSIASLVLIGRAYFHRGALRRRKP